MIIQKTNPKTNATRRRVTATVDPLNTPSTALPGHSQSEGRSNVPGPIRGGGSIVPLDRPGKSYLGEDVVFSPLGQSNPVLSPSVTSSPLNAGALTLLDTSDQVRDQRRKSRYNQRKVYQAKLWKTLEKAGLPSQAARVRSCHETFRIFECRDCKTHHDRETFPAVPSSCSHRLCPHCAARRAAKFFEEHYEGLKRIKNPKLLTVTLKSVRRLSRKDFKRLTACFGRLRARKLFQWCQGGIYGSEVTYNPAKGWHPHIHALIDAPYIPQAEIAAAWKEITGDSMVVDIRQVKRGKKGLMKAVEEVVKYPCKLDDFVDDPALVKEYLDAVAGVNLIYGFGSQYRVRQRVPYRPTCPVCGSINLASIGTVVLSRDIQRYGDGFVWAPTRSPPPPGAAPSSSTQNYGDHDRPWPRVFPFSAAGKVGDV